MFKRLVSNLPYSPALIGQVGFYAQRLRQEEATRRLGLVFTALALVVQAFAVLNPPEALASAHPQNMVYQGFNTKAELLGIYDKGVDQVGHTDIRQIYNYFGVDRQDIAQAKVGTINSRDFNGSIKSVGRISYDAGTKYEKAHRIDGTNTTVYARNLWRYDTLPVAQQNGTDYKALIGHRDDGSWFAIMFDCGNVVFTNMPEPEPEPNAACRGLSVASLSRTDYRFTARAKLQHGAKANRYDFAVINTEGERVATRQVPSNDRRASTKLTVPEDGDYQARVTVRTSEGARTNNNCTQPFTVSPEPRCPVNPSLVESNPECRPCPGNPDIWYKDEGCKPQFKTAKKVANITQSLADATERAAQPGDRMVYTLSVANTGNSGGEYTLRDNLSDVTEYADVVDADGGTVEKDEDGDVTGYISWPAETIAPGDNFSKTITVEVKESLPATPRNQGNPESYNCVMTNSFGNTTNIMVNCPPVKEVEQVVKQLPATGPGANALFGGALLAVVTYFWARSRQLKKEVKLLRKEFASGSL